MGMVKADFERNVRAIYVFNFFRMFLVFIPVMVPYFLSLGLSMGEVFKLQALFGITVGALEVPSGYLCDLIGRKKTIVLGSFLAGCGFTWLYFIDSYIELVWYEVLIGVALSFVSGADVSLLYDSLHHLDEGKQDSKENRSKRTKAMGDIQLSARVGESLASIIGGLLVKISFKTVLMAHMVAGWMPFVTSFFLKEPPYEKMSTESHLKNIKKILFHLFRTDKLLLLIFINLVTWALCTFVAVWIFQRYWQEGNIPLHYFGFLWAGYNLAVGITAKQTHLWEEKVGPIILLVALSLLPILGYFGMAYVTGWFGVIIGLSFQLSRGINQVILKDALNWRTPSEFRATANSMVSLFFRLGFGLIGPIVGISIDKFGISSTFCYLGALFLGAFIFVMIPLIMEVKKIEPEVIPYD